MYANTTTRIKFSNGLSAAFTSECGVKQGDVLNPTLFNIIIDDIVNDLVNKGNNKITELRTIL